MGLKDEVNIIEVEGRRINLIAELDDGCPVCVQVSGCSQVQKHFLLGIPIHVEKYDAVGIFSNLLKKINCILVLCEGGHPSLISDSKLL